MASQADALWLCAELRNLTQYFPLMNRPLENPVVPAAKLGSPFIPSRAAALEAVSAVDPLRYARTRNFLEGDVTRLSPYLTHGFVSVRETIQAVQSRYKLGWDGKFAFELGWREYFHHVWSHLREDIWRLQHPAPAPAYTDQMPPDIRHAATGVPVIDTQICHLYRTGYLHNHARMWIASYVVHLRKVDWRAGARWMYAHLLDGDLASNTLSWQWVAGTWTGKPYLFNADNVARYGGGRNSATAIDCSYEELDRRARSAKAYPEAPGNYARVQEPALLALTQIERLPAQWAADTPRALVPPVWIMHPWSLHLPDDRPAVGVLVTEFHTAYPWSSMRFEFVLAAMRERCQAVWIDTADAVQARLSSMAGLQAVATLNPGYERLFDNAHVQLHTPPRAYANPAVLKKSFSSFWNNVSKEPFPQ